MSRDIYATNKILQHPEALLFLARRQHQPAPVLVDFMPELRCPHSCRFCAYGHRKEGDPEERQGWKNMELMSDRFMPREKMLETVRCLTEMGVRAIELTGGGEPLIYPFVRDFFAEMAKPGAPQLGLVTSGTPLTDSMADDFAITDWRWARVSIDAGHPQDYMRTRRVPLKYWEQAWAAVERLAGRKIYDRQRVGVGFVVDNENYSGVYEACRLALEHGADNIRVTLAFSPHGVALFNEGVLEVARAQAAQAEKDFGDLDIHNLLTERAGNLLSSRQDYPRCPMQEVRCVIGGDQNVYRCCSQAFSTRGLIGSIANMSFAELWDTIAPGKFSCHDPRRDCPHECLYEQRNKAMLAAIDGVRAPHGAFV